MSEHANTDLGYGEFGDWYDAYAADVLDPALDLAVDALGRELADALSDRDLARVRSMSSRVKSKRRTWRKVNQPQYRSRISRVDDIAEVIDDLIGIRLTCTNIRDLEMVQTALENLPRQAGRKRILGLDPTSERDYVERPKPSGYRGWHVNLGVHLDGREVTCELQVRTLLQDSWGELTHEDTYSKAGELPPLVEVLSARMADLLATLDDIAEDVRTELDRIDEAVVEDARGPDDTDGHVSIDSGPGADAADILRHRWHDLDRPLELSSLAWALQQEFGAEVSDDWFGFGAFKRFVLAALPDAEISTGRQAYLLPASGATEPPVTARDLDIESTDEEAVGVPEEARQLRRIDRGFPLVETEEWRRIFEHLAEAWSTIGHATASNQTINRLSRNARDSARASGDSLSRRHLDHVARTVLGTDVDGQPMLADEIADVFTTAVLERLADLRIVTADDSAARARIGRWLLS
ncbi:MAG: GTP pyrophosphokinase family protein [Ilumatobacter sp.]